MEAVQFTPTTKKLNFTKLPIPKVEKPQDILIKVAYAGICGTDLHIIQGEFPCKEDGTLILGHEISGIVVEVGEMVKTVKKGDRVSVDPNNGCHCCHVCNAGNPHYCKIGGLNNTIGIYRNGGWAQYCLVPEEQVHKLPETIAIEQGALCEPMSCLAHGLDRVSPIPVGQKILVLGAGIIGNLWVASLHVQGHRNVTVSEPNSARLDLLKKLETNFDLLTPTSLMQKYESDPENYLFDLIVDCSGYAPAIEQAMKLLKNGGRLCIFGVAPPNAKISVSPYEMFKKETSIIGVNINPFTFPKAIGLIEAMGVKYLSYEKLGIKTFDLGDFEKAIGELKKGGIAKAVFKMK